MHKLIKATWLAAAIFILYLIFHGANLDQNTSLIQSIMMIASLLLTTGYFICYKREGLHKPQLITLIIVLGCVMRIGYMLYTPCTLRGYDLGDLTPDGYGHAAYILKLMLYHHLPESNEVQFYHPPLFHFLGAVVSSIVNGILQRTDYYDLVDAAKLVSCFASCSILLLCSQFCSELKLKASSKALVMALLAFFPSFYLMAGRVNNDALVTLFIVLAILYTYKWQKDQSYQNTIILALSYGFGMMTKASCVVTALFTFLVMCQVLTIKIQERSVFKLLPKLGCFAMISLPLGLWYHLRNFLLFGQPLGYVVRISKDLDIYCGDVPFFQRFIRPDLGNLWVSPFADPWKDNNLPVYIMKSSLFGEFTYKVNRALPVILLLIGILLILLSLSAMCLLILSNDQQPDSVRIGLPLLWGMILLFNFYFNLSYPFGCTMDFRYIVPTVILGALFLGLSYQQPANFYIAHHPMLRMVYALYQKGLPWLILIFCSFSFLMFTMIQA